MILRSSTSTSALNETNTTTRFEAATPMLFVQTLSSTIIATSLNYIISPLKKIINQKGFNLPHIECIVVACDFVEAGNLSLLNSYGVGTCSPLLQHRCQ